MDKIVIDIFSECAHAVEASIHISRVSSSDKEFSFQNWFKDRLKSVKLNFDEPSRNAYPDFRLVDYPLGFEVKGLGFPGREANYDCNSQVPSGSHNGRQIYYVFGRYPSDTRERTYPVYDLVMCHGDFLNADNDYVHKNGNLKGFGSYGDIMIRDRKMYVAPTPFALTTGTERQITLITLKGFTNKGELTLAGEMTRVETERLIRGYSFDMKKLTLTPSFLPNPSAGARHEFEAFRANGSIGPRVGMR
jgi:hypothetical protein